ncbi:protein IWS1, partial [Trifolium medium]|nr:protein IWS1 [Trifolium medium]
YRDEDGEPLMDYDDAQSDREASPEPQQLDDIEEDNV